MLRRPKQKAGKRAVFLDLCKEDFIADRKFKFMEHKIGHTIRK
jgi:hypothetical protein